MKDIKVLVTSCGSPGASTFIHYLKNKVVERKIKIIGIDMDFEPIGKFISDKFYQVPSAEDPNYLASILDIIKLEKPDILYCCSSFEVPIISENKSILENLNLKVIVASNKDAILAGNKYTLYEKLKNNEKLKLPQYFYPKNLDEFIEYAKVLGYPNKKVCFKPHFSKGSRGFRIIDDKISRKDLLLNYKPNSTFITMAEFISIFKNENEFPDFLIMEFVEGEEIDAMVLSYNGKALLTTCKTREQQRHGVITKGESVFRPEIIESCKEIIKEIPLIYNSGVQFIDGYLIEINTRVSTFIYQDDLIEPYLTIKLALGEYTEQDIANYQDKIEYGRRMIRYFDQHFH